MPALFESYRPSGSVSLPRLFIAVPIAMLITTLIAILYAYAVFYSPYDKLRIFAWVIFSIGIGLTWLSMIKPAHIRNTGIVLLVGTLLGLWGLFVQWVAWLHIYLLHVDASFNVYFLSPSQIWKMMEAINVDGAWTNNGRAVKGTELWFFWAGEAVGIVLTAIILPWIHFKSIAYCETCSSWADRLKNLHFKPIADIPGFKNQLKTGDPAFMDQLVVDNTSAHDFIRFGFRYCKGCEHAAFMRVSDIKKVLVKGEFKEQEKEILPLTHVDGTLYDALQSLSEPEVQAAIASPENLPPSTEAAIDDASQTPLNHVDPAYENPEPRQAEGTA